MFQNLFQNLVFGNNLNIFPIEMPDIQGILIFFKKGDSEMKAKKGVVIERVFDAPRDAVYRAWTKPDLMTKWWGPEGFSAPSINVDLRVGGKYVFAMRGPKGSAWDKDMYSAGIYKEIIPNAKLVVTDYFSDKNGEMLEPADIGQDPDF